MSKRIGLTLAAGAAALVLFLGAPGREATGAPAYAAEPAPRVITVFGEDEVRAAPDMATIHFGVQTQGATAEETMRKNNEAMNAVIAAVRNTGLPEDNIQTTSLSLWPTHSSAPPYTIIGYQASNNLTVTINDLNRLVWALDAAIAAGANTSGGVNFGFKDDAGLRRRALVGATGVARAKAEAIAQAMGTSIAGLHSVSEGGAAVPYPVPYPQPPVAMPGRGGDEATKTPIQPGQLTVHASVTASFLIN